MRALNLAWAIAFSVSLAVIPAASAQGAGQAANPDSATCLGCHGAAGFSAPRADKTTRSLSVQADRFAGSVHGKALQCTDCHAAMAEVPHSRVSATLAEWRKQIPGLCATCHAKQRDEYLASVHGKAMMDRGNVSAAVCSDCHTAHGVSRPQTDAVRLAITKDCGGCHEKDLKSYMDTLHGQIATLGYPQTATCADCHGGHAILPASDAASRLHSANRLKTCRECHSDASAGYVTFQPHATTNDFARYPHMWLASKSMIALLVFTFGIFWVHSALWFYREYRDRQERKARPHVRAEALPEEQGRYYVRWSPMWRAAHLVFTVSVILLVATAIPLLYPATAWAPLVMKLFGGPGAASTLHKVAAVIMVAVFAGHLVYVGIYLARNWKTFEWFGPYSLMPTWQDVSDCKAMLKWFVGRGPRPVFDHWNYTQKVDYWAPFWGIAMLTWTGAMLWFATLTAEYLPGWTFNVATIVHGEEALLAAVYLFTIHFFANHWRPDKFPMDVVMFTGSMPVEEFKREYGVEYNRLVESGELQKYLVDEPARPMTLVSKVLGFTLVAIGLVLLVMMAIGFTERLSAG